MQHIGAVDNPTPTDLVAIFPEAKRVVKLLLKECDEWFMEYSEMESRTRSSLSMKVPIYDIDLATKLVLTAHYGGEKEKMEEKRKRLERLHYLYCPPKASAGVITDANIERAREVPIKEMVKVNRKQTKCLWHNDKRPSMHIYEDNHGYCFACNKYADAIDFTMILYGLDFIGAVKKLCNL